ncbi:NAD-dependent dehydratase [Dyadobacter frigoris]|uniref:NAD-dependent dehydratase n=1 Tax=Dyadobacter frigoris TaxID=2576211 RepID=A0A4U6D4P5_9BACT|nr:NAD-dependent dehydratase [Dyadobacter frigoris]TKT91167.1 NAD-dependent dehydratase [Dyadobacter frigoris]GLU55096.1 NAD(P)-dependent oxidoreductase [Dyadobacter frigoris]
MIDQNTKIEKKRISILGCGWLGFPLAQRLLGDDISSQVKGSTTSADKIEKFKESGIEGFLFNLNPEISGNDDEIKSFFDCDTLIISIPPRLSKNEPDFHPRQVQSVIDHIKNSPVKEILYISSTSIYPDLNRIVVENDVISPEQSPSPVMVEAENLLISLRGKRSVSILRHGGLLGYNRIPGKYVKGQKNMTTGSIPVNYIHPDDSVGIIVSILQKGVVNETFNIVAPLHPTRREIYLKSCAQFGWESPTFQEPEIKPDFKIISAERLNSFYEYEFKFPDPLQFYYEE